MGSQKNRMKVIIGQILLLAIGLHCSANNCPPGWTDGLAYGMGCLLFNFNETRTWNEAQEFCFAVDNTFLVEVFSELQQEYLEEKAYEIEGMTGEGRHWWIGATDIASEGVWFWPHSHRLVDLTPWALGQPNNHDTVENREELECLDLKDQKDQLEQM